MPPEALQTPHKCHNVHNKNKLDTEPKNEISPSEMGEFIWI